jgi:hypothetical protein
MADLLIASYSAEAFYLFGFRSLTPAPPPFSPINSTPAASRARRIAKLFAAVSEVSSVANSARRIVVSPTAEDRARSSALQRTKARAARIWELFRGFPLELFISYGMFHSI